MKKTAVLSGVAKSTVENINTDTGALLKAGKNL